DSHPRIIVTDFGEGIPADQQALLFRRFSQLGAHAAGNSGLGLAISNSLVKLMQGRIAFENKPGRTSFWGELAPAAPPACTPIISGTISVPGIWDIPAADPRRAAAGASRPHPCRSNAPPAAPA